MKYAAGVLALAGLVLAGVLFSRADPSAVLNLLAIAGPGLVLASVVHSLPMMINAVAWRRLMPPRSRTTLRRVTWATWARESVNALLPVARIGGEVVAYRIVRRTGVDNIDVASSLVADIAISMITQACFTIVGLAILMLRGGASAVAIEVAVAAASMMALGLAFMRAQRAGIVGAVTGFVNRALAGRLEGAIAGSLRIDQAIREIYGRRRDVAACVVWQCAGWIAGSAEIWLALHFLGHERSVLDAIMTDALIQAISSIAFAVPAALGVQEGGFVLLGTLLGLDAPTALALAAARRLRDLIVYFPGLLAWHWAETRGRRESQSASDLT